MLGNFYLITSIVVLLMLMDYFLTLKGYSLYSRKYSKNVELESYELNPTFGNNIKQGKYSLRHALSIFVIVGILFLIHFCIDFCQFSIISTPMLYMAEGMLLSAFTYVNVRHLKNILIFKSVDKNPKLLQGKVFQSKEFSLKASIIDCFATFLILFVVLLSVPNFFTLGFASGPLIVMFAHIRWIKKD